MEDLFKQINQEKIAQYQTHLEKLDLSKATIKRRLSTLRRFYNWAEKEGYLEKPPQKAPIAKEAPSMPTIPFISDAYEVYHSISITKYLHYAILIIFCTALGFGIYQQFIARAPEPLAYPTALTRPNRYLSFQGRLTDSSNNPITTATNFVFKLYDAASAGNTLWNSGTCAITPDQDGIFSVILGLDCGAEIAASVFTENASVWLGITVGADAEATPRIQVATVAYALNAETLQGYPPGTGTSTVPYINSTGKVVIAASSPTVQATSGTFSIEGQTGVTIQAASGQNGNITLSPKGTGRVVLSGFEASTGNLFDVQGGANIGGSGGKEANTIIYGYAGTNSTNLNLLKLEAGATPNAKFTVDASGNASAAGYLKALTTGSYFTGDVTVSGGTITGANSEQLKLGVTNDTVQVVRGASTYTVCDSSGNCQSATGGYIGGSGTANRVAKFTDTYTIGNSGINDLSDALAITIDSSENVGIGTTNPSKKLHVAGECVAEDSLIPVCNSSTSEECIRTPSEVSYAQIKDIQPGDFVLSLNEQTSQFQWQKVEKTLDKGEQEVYELITEGGKRIETTGNHPYLTRDGWKKVVYLSEGEEIAVLRTTRKGENQNKTYQGNNQGNDGKNNLSAHSTSLSGKPINNNQNYSRRQTGNREKGNPVVFYHDLTPLVKNIPALREPLAKAIPQRKESTTSHQFLGRAIKGLITPATNQATPMLERNSATSLLWPTDNLFTNSNNSTLKKEMSSDWEKIVSIKRTGRRHVYDLQIENTYNFVANGIVAHNTYINSSSANALLVENAGTYNSILSVDGSTGRVGIGTTSPTSLLSVGATSQFQVNTSGDVIKLKNLTYSWPSSHVSSSFLRNDGSGNLTWSTDITVTSLKWNALTDPDGNLTLAHGANTTTMGWTSTGALNAWTMNFNNNSTSATTQNAFIINNALVGSFTDTTTENLLLLQQLDTTAAGTTVVDNALKIDSAGNSNIIDAIEIANSVGNITNAINIADTTGTITTGILMSGTFTNLIDTPTFDVNNAGTVTIATAQSYTGSGTVTLSSAAASALTINSGTTGSIGIGDDASAETITLGTGAAAKAVTVGSTNTTSSLTLDSGTGAINIGTSIAKTITIGNTTGATALALNSGTGDITLASTDQVKLNSSKAAGGTTTEAFSIKSTVDLGATDEVLQVGDSAADFLTIRGDGNVGIGTTGPGTRLEVRDAPAASTNVLAVYNTAAQASGDITIATLRSTATAGTQNIGDTGLYIWVNKDTVTPSVSLRAGGVQTTNLILQPTGGNVGIGTTAPTSLLSVGATSQFQVNSTGNLSINTGTSATVITAERSANGYVIETNVGGTPGVDIGTEAGVGHAVIAFKNTDILVGKNGTSGIAFGSGVGWADVPAGATDINIKGNVGIGTASPSSFKLEVAGNIGPEATGTRDLGSTARVWNNVYANNYYQGSTAMGIWLDAGTYIYPANVGTSFQIADTTGNLTVPGTASFNNAGVTIDASSYVNAQRFVDIGSNYYLDPAATGYSLLVAGSVGIGTTSPGAKLDVRKASGNVQAIIGSNNIVADTVYIRDSSINAGYDANANAELNLNYVGYQNGTTQFRDLNIRDGKATSIMFVDGSAGNVGIGTTNPQAKLDIAGASSVISNSAGDITINAASNYISFAGDSLTNINNLYVSGNVGIGTTGPSYKLDVSGTGRFTDNVYSHGGFYPGNSVLQTSRKFGDSGTWLTASNLYMQGTLSMGNQLLSDAGAIRVYSDNLDIQNTGGNAKFRFKTSNGSLWIGGATADGTAAAPLHVVGNGVFTGNVGIGTTGPISKLNVNGADFAGGLTLTGGDSTNISIMPDKDHHWSYNSIYSDASGHFTLQPRWDGTNKNLILNPNSGNVGIGTTGPGSALHVYGGAPRIQIQGTTAGSNVGLQMRAVSANSTARVGGYYFFPGDTTASTFLGLSPNDSGYAMVVTNPGNVGIGTTNPGSYKLYVNGDTYVNGKINSLDLNSRVISGSYVTNSREICVKAYDPAGATGTEKCSYGGTCTTSGAIRYVCMQTGPAADLAEFYETSNLLVNEGDLVASDNLQALYIKKTTGAYDPLLIGIVSTQPAWTFGESKENTRPVALTGRVPAKVTSQNGSVEIGDHITAGSIPGFGMKIVKAGVTAGTALEFFEPNDSRCPLVSSVDAIIWPEDDGTNPAKPCFRLPDGTFVGKIMVFVNVSWHDPDVYLTDTGELQIVQKTQNTQSIGESENQNIGESEKYSLVDSAGKVIERVGAFAEVAIANLRAGIVETKELISDLGYFGNLRVEEKLISPLVETEQLTAGSVTADSIQATESKFGKLISTQIETDELQVNKDATIAGTLYADKVVAREIVGVQSKFGELITASISAQRIEGLEERLAQLETQASPTLSPSPTPSPTPSISPEPSATESGEIDALADIELSPDIEALVNEILNTSLEATPQATLAYTEGEDLNIINSLTVLGTTSLADTSIAGSLNIGGTMSLADNSINSLTGPLYLQNLGLGGIDILAGKIVIDEKGNMIIEGNVTIKGKLALSEIEPLPEKDLTINLSNQESKFGKLLVKGVNNEIVASIDASGSAFFAKLGIEADYSATQSGAIIAAYDNWKENRSFAPAIKTNATAGIGILPAGETEIQIYNPNITNESLIYVVPTSETENKVLFVKAKQAQNDAETNAEQRRKGWFKIAIDMPIKKDIQFNWWIVGGAPITQNNAETNAE